MGLFKKKEEEQEKKSKFYFREVPKQPLGKKNIFLIALMVVLGLVILFFLSTYLRWNSDISNYSKVIAYKNNDKIIYNNDKNESFEVLEVKDFYDSEYKLELNDNEAAILYCGNRRTDSSKCYYIDVTNGMENTFRDPFVVICFLVVCELVLLFLILMSREKKDKKFNNIFGGAIILVSGVLLGMQLFQILNYYVFVNGNENISNGVITKEIKNSNTDGKILPIIEYSIDDNTYTYIGKKTTDKRVNDEITLYYKTKDYSYVTEKRNPIKVLNIISIVCLLVVGILYIRLTKINPIKKESNEQ